MTSSRRASPSWADKRPGFTRRSEHQSDEDCERQQDQRSGCTHDRGINPAVRPLCHRGHPNRSGFDAGGPIGRRWVRPAGRIRLGEICRGGLRPGVTGPRVIGLGVIGLGRVARRRIRGRRGIGAGAGRCHRWSGEPGCRARVRCEVRRRRLYRRRLYPTLRHGWGGVIGCGNRGGGGVGVVDLRAPGLTRSRWHGSGRSVHHVVVGGSMHRWPIW
jgi:hypothetical protein